MELLDPLTQPKFVEDLVNPLSPEFLFVPRSDGSYKIKISPFKQKLGLVDLKTGKKFKTKLYGYGDKKGSTYPGRTFLVNKNQKINVTFENKLVDKHGKPLPAMPFVPIDTTVHWAMPMDPPYPKSGIPTVVHLHGGHTEDESDGYPEAWFTPNFEQVGPKWVKKIYTYDNTQNAATLWYHDHTLGITRVNVYTGMAGFYIIQDERERKLICENKLPTFPYDIPIIVQDKDFTKDGQLFFPSKPYKAGLPNPTIIPSFFGHFILTNGKIWPKLNADPRWYRFRLLNACDSRELTFQFVYKDKDNKEIIIPFYKIATDQGFLRKPILLGEVLVGQSQRVEILINLSDFKGQKITVKNINKGEDMGDYNPETTGLIFQINISKDKNKDIDFPRRMGEKIPRLIPNKVRQVLLVENEDEFTRFMPLLGTVELGGLEWKDPITEKIQLDTTEIWEIFNPTTDRHPIHLHSGRFQFLNHQKFTADTDPKIKAITNIKFTGPIVPADKAEEGWLDTVLVYIGEVNRIIMHFDLPGLYVWHCHILSHEDHDMMRSMLIIKNK
jgi:spore coat protein A